MKSRTLTVAIARDPRSVYDFVADARNLPQWAAGLCRSVRPAEGGWAVETPQGTMTLRFAPRNDLGVLDHYVRAAPGAEVYVPMRVVANGTASEVIFTLFQAGDMTDEQFAADARLVEADLHRLKRILEARGDD